MLAMRSVAFALSCVIAFTAVMTSFNTLAHAEDEAPVAKRKVLKAADGSSDEEESSQVKVPPRDGAMNIRVSPLGLLIGYFNADFDIKVSPNWTIGPTASYWSFNFDSGYYPNGIRTEMWAIGARANWGQHGAFKNGLFFSPIFQYRSAKASGVSINSGRTITAEAATPVITGLVGYQWFGQTLNMSLGAGLSFGASSDKVTVTDGTQTVEVTTSKTAGLAIDFMIGYVF